MGAEGWMQSLGRLAEALAWPAIALTVFLLFRRALSVAVDAISSRIARGDELKTPWLTLGQSSGRLKKPSSSELITDDHLALIHRSWRDADSDAKHDGDEMYQIHVIVFGDDDALDRVEYVIYRLDPAYPNPVMPGGLRETNFELRELANGFSQIRAEVKIKDQDEIIHLSRFIDLMAESPPLKGEYFE